MNPAILIGAAVLLFALRGKGGGAAGSLAKQLAADITKRKYDYSRALCKRFQLAAGVKPADGIYGPATKAALGKYVSKPPAALFAGKGAKKKKPAQTAPKLPARTSVKVPA